MTVRFLVSSLVLMLFSGYLNAEDTVVSAKAAVQRSVQAGFTRAHTRLILSSERSGRVVEVNGDVGDTIKKGIPFACLDDTYIGLELQANRAERAALEIDKDYFTKEKKRYSKLLKKNSSSVSQLDSARRNLNKTTTSLEALEVEAKVLREHKKRLCVSAPAGWQVIKRFVEPGVWVNVGEPVVEIGDYKSLSVPFALSMIEYQSLRNQESTGLQVTLPDFEAEIPARLFRVSPAFDESSRKIHVELELVDELPSHRGGIRVELGLNLPTQSGAVLVPEQALQQHYEQHWLKRHDGTDVAVVYLGRSLGADDGWVRVVSPDIKPGDRFLLHSD
ncbi:MAG: efflux RND transporter periplasmic adaptor subunit [Candidatus Thiodiazotropha sp.]